ncbi:cell division protein FtsQ/DivIB [Marinomonas primoryensis]|uniref:cell division protein FtsQ/DivIB n=1 Tax=Marinomonas primoryensis TaxID=178399 RepID=UPI001EF7B1C3|nr:FtsQ-type POTRA domain-containing protein [Marinomonas primoryensis]
MAALIGAVLLVLVASFQSNDSPDTWFAIQKIEIKGDFKYAVEDDLQADFSSLLGQSLLGVSLSDSLVVVLSSEWVASAEIRKVWPNTLQVLVHEYTPLAYWGIGN